MNNGDDTAYYLHRGFQVVAIEADPQLVERARHRFAKAIKSGDLSILNAGVADREGELPFWICETHPEWSSFDPSIASRDGSKHRQISVSCRRFETVLEEFGTPHYLKVDIEGNDRLCLQALKREALPDYLSVEADGLNMLGTIAELGYARFKCISQYHLIPLEIPLSAEQLRLERALALMMSRNIFLRVLRRLGAQRWLSGVVNRSRSVNGWTFLPGSSGTFGEDLPGKWMSYSEMREVYEAFLQMKEEGKKSCFWNENEYSFWADFHAAR